jgi:thymidylate synthase
MRQYLDLLLECRRYGKRQKNRTGIDTFMIPGGMMQFDFTYGFPIITTKRIAFGQVVGELLGFIRGYDNARDFRKLGCTIWDANANRNAQWLKNPLRQGTDDLGRIYGVQWRDWEDGRGRHIDQLGLALHTLLHDPQSRRIIVSAWNPTQLNQMALPPCHLLYQFLYQQEGARLHMTMYMRSCDMFLGVPFNISSYALLLSLVSYVMALTPGRLTMFLADVHIYENHLEQVDLQLSRTPMQLPRVHLSEEILMRGDNLSPIERLERIEPSDIHLDQYEPHGPIRGEMAI